MLFLLFILFFTTTQINAENNDKQKVLSTFNNVQKKEAIPAEPRSKRVFSFEVDPLNLIASPLAKKSSFNLKVDSHIELTEKLALSLSGYYMYDKGNPYRVPGFMTGFLMMGSKFTPLLSDSLQYELSEKTALAGIRYSRYSFDGFFVLSRTGISHISIDKGSDTSVYLPMQILFGTIERIKDPLFFTFAVGFNKYIHLSGNDLYLGTTTKDYFMPYFSISLGMLF